MYPRRNCDATDAEEVAMQLAQMALEPQVPPPPLVSLDQVIQSAHPTGVLNSQGGFIEHLLERARRGDSAHQFKDLTSPATAGADSLRQPLLPFDDLRPADRLECTAFLSAPNKVFWGKYLLCQTISSAIRDVVIEVIVTDPAGRAAMRLVLYNYSAVEKSVLEVNFDEILPPGSYLVLKNPCWMSTPSGWLVMLSENPQDVELVSKKGVEAKFPGLEWIGTIPTEEFHYSQKRHFWKDLKDEAAAFGKLKGLGNKGFLDKRFSDALRFYDMALEYCAENKENEAMIHSNKSAALLALGCFGAALKCAEVALEVNPGSEKYNYRKTKALIGLRKYAEGLSFLQQKFYQFSSLSKNKDCNTLLENVKFLASRKNLGPTESQLLAIRINTLSKEEIIPEFISPSTVISKIEGKGRQLFLTNGHTTIAARGNFAEIECKVSTTFAMPPEKQRLLWAGKDLKTHFEEMSDGATVFVCSRLVGGNDHDNCWNCGLKGHHRRDCTTPVTKGSASLVKKEAAAIFRQSKNKTKSEQEKWKKRQEISNSEPVCEILLKKHISHSLEYVLELECFLEDILPLTFENLKQQLTTAQTKKEEMLYKFQSIREVVLHAKNFLKKIKPRKEEDAFMELDLDYLDEVRQKIHGQFTSIIANIQELLRQIPNLQTIVDILHAKVLSFEDDLGERSPSIEKLEEIGGRIILLEPDIKEAQKKVSYIKTQIPNFKYEGLTTIISRLSEISSLRKQMTNWQLEELRQGLTCGICFDRKKEWALRCGHQLCAVCIATLKTQQQPKCPFCQRRLEPVVQLFQ